MTSDLDTRLRQGNEAASYAQWTPKMSLFRGMSLGLAGIIAAIATACTGSGGRAPISSDFISTYGQVSSDPQARIRQLDVGQLYADSNIVGDALVYRNFSRNVESGSLIVDVEIKGIIEKTSFEEGEGPMYLVRSLAPQESKKIEAFIGSNTNIGIKPNYTKWFHIYGTTAGPSEVLYPINFGRGALITDSATFGYSSPFIASVDPSKGQPTYAAGSSAAMASFDATTWTCSDSANLCSLGDAFETPGPKDTRIEHQQVIRQELVVDLTHPKNLDLLAKAK